MVNDAYNHIISVHKKTEDFIIPEATRLHVIGTQPFNIYELDDSGDIIDILTANSMEYNNAMYNVESIQIECKGNYKVVMRVPKHLDKTPIEVGLPQEISNLSLLKQQLQGEMLADKQMKAKMPFLEFIDVQMEDELQDIFGQATVYEAKAEAVRQHFNPLRSFNLEKYVEARKNRQDEEKHENDKQQEKGGDKDAVK
jgi:hypothetical protein